MPEENQTITEDAASSPASVDSTGLLRSTVEDDIPSIPTSQDEQPVKDNDDNQQGESNVDKDKGQDETNTDLDRFDKHPRFQQLIAANRELKESLEQIKASMQPKEPDTKHDEPSISDLDDDTILDNFNENPKQFLQNFAKQITSQLQEQAQVQSEEQRIQGTLSKYVDKNPDFNDLWDDGSIKRYMSENPGHNAISAHMAMVADKRMEEAIKAAEKATEERIMKNIKAKQGARVISSGPSAGGARDGLPPELQNPQKYGGVTNVLAARLAARRRGAA